MEDIGRTEKHEEDIANAPTLKMTALDDPSQEDKPAAKAEAATGPTARAHDESEAAEVMEEEGGLGWIVLLVIIAAAVGVAARARDAAGGGAVEVIGWS